MDLSEQSELLNLLQLRKKQKQETLVSLDQSYDLFNQHPKPSPTIDIELMSP